MRSERAQPVVPRPRYRYVLFAIKSARTVSRGDFVQAIRRVGGADRAWLTRFDGRHGILRCARGDEASIRRLLTRDLRALGLDIDTLSTSGTIAALERRHRGLDLRGRD